MLVRMKITQYSSPAGGINLRPQISSLSNSTYLVRMKNPSFASIGSLKQMGDKKEITHPP